VRILRYKIIFYYILFIIMIVIRNLFRLSVCIILFFVYINVHNLYFKNKFIIDYLMLVFGFLLVYCIFTLCGAKETGQCVPLMFIIGNKHIHHWMYFTILLLIALFFKAHSFILGAFLGGICHGIQYKDWNSVRLVKCHRLPKK
jgi:hypothetical protein